jgi:hypothetical protein
VLCTLRFRWNFPTAVGIILLLTLNNEYVNGGSIDEAKIMKISKPLIGVSVFIVHHVKLKKELMLNFLNILTKHPAAIYDVDHPLKTRVFLDASHGPLLYYLCTSLYAQQPAGVGRIHRAGCQVKDKVAAVL